MNDINSWLLYSTSFKKFRLLNLVSLLCNTSTTSLKLQFHLLLKASSNILSRSYDCRTFYPASILVLVIFLIIKTSPTFFTSGKSSFIMKKFVRNKYFVLNALPALFMHQEKIRNTCIVRLMIHLYICMNCRNNDELQILEFVSRKYFTLACVRHVSPGV